MTRCTMDTGDATSATESMGAPAAERAAADRPVATQALPRGGGV